MGLRHLLQECAVKVGAAQLGQSIRRLLIWRHVSGDINALSIEELEELEIRFGMILLETFGEVSHLRPVCPFRGELAELDLGLAATSRHFDEGAVGVREL